MFNDIFTSTAESTVTFGTTGTGAELTIAAITMVIGSLWLKYY